MNVTIIETTMHTKYKRLVEAELLEEHLGKNFFG